MATHGEWLPLCECENTRWLSSRADRLDHFIGLSIRVVDQTERRIVDQESVPAEEKIVSIFARAAARHTMATSFVYRRAARTSSPILLFSRATRATRH